MATIRVEKTKNYTVMSNHHLRNKNLSLKTKGLLSFMLSLPDDWDYTTKGLANICKEGVDSISTSLKELEAEGYLVRKRARNDKGVLGKMEYTIYERPITEKSEKPKPEPKKAPQEKPVETATKDKKEKPEYYAEFVKMTEEEYKKLIERYGEAVTARSIEILDNYKGSTGKKYKSDYRTILNWVADRAQQELRGGQYGAYQQDNRTAPGNFKPSKGFKD